MKLSTDLGPHEKQFPMPFGIKGHIVVRRRTHPLAGGREFDFFREDQRRRLQHEMKAATKRCGGDETRILRDDEDFKTFAHALGMESDQRSMQFAASLVSGFSVDGVEGEDPAAFFDEETSIQSVPRFEDLEGVPVVDPELMREAHGIASACDSDTERMRTELRSQPEELAARVEKRREQMTKAMEKIKVRISPHAGKRLDFAMAEVIIGYAGEVQEEFDKANGFFSDR